MDELSGQSIEADNIGADKMINTNIQNPYVIEHCRIRGIRQGEEISNVEYIIWIDNQHRKFQQMQYKQEVFGHDEEYKREFMKYLQGLEAERREEDE